MYLQTAAALLLDRLEVGVWIQKYVDIQHEVAVILAPQGVNDCGKYIIIEFPRDCISMLYAL